MGSVIQNIPRLMFILLLPLFMPSPLPFRIADSLGTHVQWLMNGTASIDRGVRIFDGDTIPVPGRYRVTGGPVADAYRPNTGQPLVILAEAVMLKFDSVKVQIQKSCDVSETMVKLFSRTVRIRGNISSTIKLRKQG
jgi:hypothetical protein